MSSDGSKASDAIDGPAGLANADTLDPDSLDLVVAHGGIASATVATGAGNRSPRSDAPLGFAPGDRIDRFVIIDVLGSGGMGIVFAARDPELDRKVAIKILRADFSGRESAAQARKLLLREGRAMARLSHPNVVAVHEVGTIGEQVFVAMEYVAGRTIDRWQAEEEPDDATVVARFVAAGRGLAAAHSAGMVHRDFKPQNVLVADDGRVLVTDFGLASTVGAAIERSPGAADDMPATALDATLTRTGVIMGTPFYMAPEQHAGGEIDGRADQFAFCVALYEALCGVRPFAGDGYWELRANVEKGRLRAASGQSISPGLDRISRRGLAPEVADRHGSIDELLDALERAARPPRRWRWRRAGLVVGAAGLVGLAWASWVSGGGGDRRCRGVAADLAGAWDADIAAQVERSFAASGRHHAAATYARVASGLENYATAWVEMRGESCRATHIDGAQSEEILDLRTRCLDGRRAELGALTALLSDRADGDVVDRAVEAIEQLSPLAPCADAAALAAAVPLPSEPAARARVEALQRSFDEAEALRKAGKYRAGLKLAEHVAQQVGELYPPLAARALYLSAVLHRRLGDMPRCEASLRRSIEVGASAKEDFVVAEAWVLLIQVVGYELRRVAEAEKIASVAEVALARIGDPPALHAELLKHMGNVMVLASEVDRAYTYHSRAVALAEDEWGADDARMAPYLNDLAGSLKVRGDTEEARATYERALTLDVAAHGQDHPFVASSLYNIALTYTSDGDRDTALDYARRAQTIWSRELGADHPFTLRAQRVIADCLVAKGDYAAAMAAYEKILLAIESAAVSEPVAVPTIISAMAWAQEHAGELAESRRLQERAIAMFSAVGAANMAAGARSQLARVIGKLGDYQLARATYAEVIAERETLVGHINGDVTYDLHNLAELIYDNGAADEARPYFERVVEIWTERHGRGYVMLLHPLLGMALCDLDRGALVEARANLERALSLSAQSGVDANHRGEVEFALARALRRSGRERKRALTLAEQARGHFAEGGDAFADRVATVDRWLRQR